MLLLIFVHCMFMIAFICTLFINKGLLDDVDDPLNIVADACANGLYTAIISSVIMIIIIKYFFIVC